MCLLWLVGAGQAARAQSANTSAGPSVYSSHVIEVAGRVEFTGAGQNTWLKGFALSGLYVVLAHWALASAITRSRRTGLLLKLSE